MTSIQDQFTSLGISKQKRYQLRQNAKGLCRFCNDKSMTSGGVCLKHAISNRENMREKNKSKRRNNSLTYRLSAVGAAVAKLVAWAKNHEPSA